MPIKIHPMVRMFFLLLITGMSGLLFSNMSDAQQVDNINPESVTLEALEKYITQLRNIIIEQNSNTTVLMDRVEKLEQELRRIEAQQEAARRDKENQEKASQDSPTDPALVKKIDDERAQNARLIEAAFEQKLITAGGLLMQPGEYSYEPSFTYSNASVDRIVVDGFSLLPVLVIGDIVSEKVRRETMTITNSFRAGLPHDFQLEIQIPYGYEKQAITSGDNEHNNTYSSGVGDITLSLSHQLVKSSKNWPDTLMSLGWKSDTGQDPYRLTDSQELALGTGFKSYNLSLTSVKISDPLALHYGLSLSKTARDLKSIGYIKPGAGVRLYAGTSMAINLDTSISFSFQLSYTDETEFEGKDISGSDYTTATLSMGLSRTLSIDTAIDFNVGIGLTEDAPDFQVTIAIPMRLD